MQVFHNQSFLFHCSLPLQPNKLSLSKFGRECGPAFSGVPFAIGKRLEAAWPCEKSASFGLWQDTRWCVLAIEDKLTDSPGFAFSQCHSMSDFLLVVAYTGDRLVRQIAFRNLSTLKLPSAGDDVKWTRLPRPHHYNRFRGKGCQS